MSILSIDHVQVAVPTGSEDRARAFYCGVLGFAEIDKPPQMAERKSIWFVAGTVNLHLGLESDFIPAKRAHPAFVVDSLDAILSACEHAGIVTRPDTSINNFRRVHVFDPFGNRLELMERIP
jgi:catechol 2,3-dioxygenase-like lactoylglutathione lyase family enzyme